MQSVLDTAFIVIVGLFGATIFIALLRFMIEGDGGEFIVALFTKRGRAQIRDWWRSRRGH